MHTQTGSCSPLHLWGESSVSCLRSLLLTSRRLTLFNRCFLPPVFQIISQKDEHCWVGELNGLRGESGAG